MERVDAAIVGAGLAGLSCAYALAKAGMDVLVVERGDYPGSKNVTGGRLYMNPVRQYLPDNWHEAPFERHVAREKLTMLSDEAALSLELRPENYTKEPHHSYTLLRPVFDRWLAEKAAKEGAAIIPKYKVDGVLHENGRISGIRAEGEEIAANVVVAADGALSFIAEQAGLRSRHGAEHFAVGVKETIELPRKTIEERFNLHGDEGSAQLYFGSVTKGLTGGGFLYTNRESLSLGIVVGIGSLMANTQQLEILQLMEEFKARPEISVLIEGGQMVEYSAHTIPEGGIKSMPTLFTDGMIIVGDAASFALNMGIIVRGMDLAIASGAIGAKAIETAKKRNNYSAESLASYKTMLDNSFVLKDLRTFRNIWTVLNNQRLFTKYPHLLNELMIDLMSIGAEPKPKLSSTVLKSVRKNFLNISALKDGLSLLKI